MPLTCPNCAKPILPTWLRCPQRGQLLTAVTAPLRPATPLPAWLIPGTALLALTLIALLLVGH
jgi:hypothetical protein